MSGAISPLPNTPSWRGAWLKHRDDFTFTFTSRSFMPTVSSRVAFRFHKRGYSN
jgi:hypothetical protein